MASCKQYQIVIWSAWRITKPSAFLKQANLLSGFSAYCIGITETTMSLNWNFLPVTYIAGTRTTPFFSFDHMFQTSDSMGSVFSSLPLLDKSKCLIKVYFQWPFSVNRFLPALLYWHCFSKFLWMARFYHEQLLCLIVSFYHEQLCVFMFWKFCIFLGRSLQQTIMLEEYHYTVIMAHYLSSMIFSICETSCYCPAVSVFLFSVIRAFFSWI